MKELKLEGLSDLSEVTKFEMLLTSRISSAMLTHVHMCTHTHRSVHLEYIMSCASPICLYM